MSLDILKSKIKENELSGVFLFYGPEEYTKDHYATRIRKKVDSSPIPEFNHIYFNAAQDRISDLEDAVFSLPYMWESKLIEITDLENTRLTESDLEDYARIFSDIPDYLTILIVLRNDEKIEKSQKKDNEKQAQKEDTSSNNDGVKNSQGGFYAFIKLVETHGLAVRFESEKSDKLVTWISKHLNAKGITFEYNVPREVINICGSDMYILQGEISKLAEVYSGKAITAADVKKYCCVNNDYKYFDLTNALNRRDLVSAKAIWESLDVSKEETSMALGYISKNYYEMLLTKQAIDSGKNINVIAKSLKKPEWQIRKMSSAVSAVDVRTLNYAISQLSEADMKLKNYRGNPQRILEFAFYRICTYGRKA